MMLQDQLLFDKRSMIETIIYQLKKISRDANIFVILVLTISGLIFFAAQSLIVTNQRSFLF